MTRRPKSLRLLLALVAPLAACDADSIDLGPARQAWLETKASCDGAYHYTHFHSSSTGTLTVTKVEIVADRPTARRLEPTGPGASTWSETGAEVGTHTEGWPALTMEQVYDACARDVLSLDPDQYTRTVEADARGVLQHCGSTVKKGCATDCSQGYSLGEFDCGPLPPDSTP
jgi:hypothetical protein